MSLTDDIERVLPYDGPHSADTVTDAAYGISRLVRYLNNATQGAGTGHVGNGQVTLAMAPTVDSVVGSVKAAAYLLDQLLRQLSEALERLSADPTLYNDVARDDPESASNVALTAAHVLVRAQTTTRDLATVLEDAQTLTAHLGHNAPARG